MSLLKGAIPWGLFLFLVVGCAMGSSLEKYESPKYQVLEKSGNLEIRRYKSYLVARTSYDESKGETSSTAFRRLFKYISGNNRAQEKIPMTVPVAMSPEKSASIEMTVPVTQQGKGAVKSMSFVVPARFAEGSVPQPLDTKVSIESVPAETRGVIRFSWLAGDAKKKRKSEELRQWMEQLGRYQIVSEPIYAAYDSPFVLPPFKTHEMMFVLQEKSPSE